MKLSTNEFFKNMNQSSDRYVSLEGDLLRRYQMELLGILEDVVSLCEEEHIMHELGGGSALGAVRHGGFIPWDDDVDFNILRADFPRFRAALKNKFGDKYCLQTWESPEWALPAACLRLNGSIIRTREDTENDAPGFYIDIFLIENVPNNIILRGIHGFFCLGFAFLLSCRHFYRNRALMREIERENPDCKRVFELKILIGRLISFASPVKWAGITNKCYGFCKNNKSKYVNFPAGRKHYFGEIHPRDAITETVNMNFEGHSWPVPKGYDAYFTKLYGKDYMVVPPPSEREKHMILEIKFPEDY